MMQQGSIRHLRAVGPALAGYLRPGSRDSGVLARLISQGLPVGSGVVYDPTKLDRSEDLRDAAATAGLERIMDPRSVELSTLGGFDRSGIQTLPWAGNRPHRPVDLTGDEGRRFVVAIADVAIESRATAVLSPTHFLEHSPPDWLRVDRTLTLELRQALDQAGGEHVAIYYPVVTTLRVARSNTLGRRIRDVLEDLARAGAIDAAWLRIHPFGTASAGPLNLSRYIEYAQSLQEIGVPLVAERTGTIGLALLGFNAVGGIESSVTYGDRYDHRSLTRPSSGSGFVPPPRVYLQEVGAMADKGVAEALYERRGIRGRHQCSAFCCPRGTTDTLSDPRRHFIVSRTAEISRLTSVPDVGRPESYMADWLRPASDRMIQVVKAAPRLASHRERLDNWRMTLTKILDDGVTMPATSLIPTGRRVRRSA
jgi:hypothetical protein